MEAGAKTIQKNMIWNVAGSLSFIAAQWLMTILIVWLAGYEEAGVLSLGLSLTNVFTNVAYFAIRNFQVSDVSGNYDSSVYVTHRLFTSFAAVFLYGVFVLLNGYSSYVTAFLLLFMLYRVTEPLVDVFHGIDQRAWRLDVAGKSFLARGALSLILFVVLEKTAGNLAVTAAGMAAAMLGIVLFYDIPGASRIEKFSPVWKDRRMLTLTKECFPLFVYALCLNAVVPIPRYFLEKMAGEEILGFYSSVAIPASVIQLLASYVFTTFTGLFTTYYREKKKREFLMLFGKLSAWIAGLVAVSLGGSALLGEWALCLIFTEEIRAYAYLLVPTVFCCGLIAFIWFLGTVLTVLRDTKGLCAGAVCGAVVCLVLSWPCIRRFGVDGVNVSLALSSLATLAVFGWRFWRVLRNYFY